MGGGAAMRTAAKVTTGFGLNGVFRGNPSRSLPDSQAVAVAARRASNPPASAAAAASASVSSSVAIEDINSAVHNLSHNGRADAASIHRLSSWETDDWDYADDGEELLLSDSKHTMPRFVFGGVPTLEEAKEATSELKDAFGGNSSMFSQAEYSVTKACITSDAVVSSTSGANPVFRAFSLLKESPEAQNVVASLASDKNVWDAVMQNDKVMEFLKLQQTSNDGDDDQKLPEGSADDNYDAKHDEGFGNIFMESIQKIKHAATEMMNDLSTFVQNLFGGQEAGNISVDGNGNASVNKTIGASFMALAVLAIMVVVLKRG